MKLQVNGKEQECSEGIFLTDLIEQLALPIEGLVAVVADEVVPASDWKDCSLNDGMKIEFLNFVSGG